MNATALPTVALCTMLRNERPYILEWVAYHSLLGVSDFLIADNESTDGSDALLTQMQRAGLINTVYRKGSGMKTQLDAFLDGARFFHSKVDFVGFFDIDEFLVTEGEKTLPQALSEFSIDIGAIATCQLVYGSNGFERYDSDLVANRFTARARDLSPQHQWVKTIARPGDVKEMTSSHSVSLRTGRYVMTDFQDFRPAGKHPGEADRICHERIRYNHYMLKSEEEFRQKQARGALSDSPNYRRFEDSYFFDRETVCNVVIDSSAARISTQVMSKMGEMLDRLERQFADAFRLGLNLKM
jgi:hypothetical protein